ncbi:MAG: HlyD family efflux transporter periplasmic adaptor subunit, partial [Defluviitaleaceae bacterium]|nr:HlyD family efflux transporter periplasmic adaptor subunit [Defluviitaleaceae bacterium]
AALDLQEAKQQLALIRNEPPEFSAEYYSAMKESLRAQIAETEKTIAMNYNSKTEEYFRNLIDVENFKINELEKIISDSVVTAPFSGIIERLYVKNTNRISPEEPVAVISSVGENRVTVFVNTVNIDNCWVGQKTTLLLKRTGGDIFHTGEVVEIDPTAEIRISPRGTEERVVKVTIIPDAPDDFKTGYDVEARFVFYREENKLTVPKTAIFSRNEKYFVWIVQNGKLVEREIIKGAELLEEICVENGISQNEIIAANIYSENLKPGMRIKN